VRATVVEQTTQQRIVGERAAVDLSFDQPS